MLARRLPAHMIPAIVNILAALPRLPNLKIDRTALEQIDRTRSTVNRTDDPLLDTVASLFETAVETTSATADDTVLSLGGDSFDAAQLGAEIERRYSIVLPKGFMEANPTIGTVAEYLREYGKAETRRK
jgi:acyl carrier protein